MTTIGSIVLGRLALRQISYRELKSMPGSVVMNLMKQYGSIYDPEDYYVIFGNNEAYNAYEQMERAARYDLQQVLIDLQRNILDTHRDEFPNDRYRVDAAIADGLIRGQHVKSLRKYMPKIPREFRLMFVRLAASLGNFEIFRMLYDRYIVHEIDIRNAQPYLGDIYGIASTREIAAHIMDSLPRDILDRRAPHPVMLTSMMMRAAEHFSFDNNIALRYYLELPEEARRTRMVNVERAIRVCGINKPRYDVRYIDVYTPTVNRGSSLIARGIYGIDVDNINRIGRIDDRQKVVVVKYVPDGVILHRDPLYESGESAEILYEILKQNSVAKDDDAVIFYVYHPDFPDHIRPIDDDFVGSLIRVIEERRECERTLFPPLDGEGGGGGGIDDDLYYDE